MFSRTPSGIRNKSLFYAGEYFVYVEGKDDVAFWKIFFTDQINNYKSRVVPVGGKEETKKYIEQIINHDAKFVVAVDSDYRLLLGEKIYNHPRIIETQCHSIENVMLFPSSISLIIRNFTRHDDYDKEIIERWLTDFDLTAYLLMIADVFIEKNKLGKKCTEQNCQRFLKKNSHELDNTKINLYIESLGLSDISKDSLFDTLKNFRPRHHIRGHFYLNAVTCFVCQEVKRLTGSKGKPSISDDSFYALALTSCKAALAESGLSEYLQEQAVLAAEDVIKLLKK